MGQKPVPPIPIPTKIKPKMGGAPTQKLATHSHFPSTLAEGTGCTWSKLTCQTHPRENPVSPEGAFVERQKERCAAWKGMHLLYCIAPKALNHPAINPYMELTCSTRNLLSNQMFKMDHSTQKMNRGHRKDTGPYVFCHLGRTILGCPQIPR